VLHLTQIAQRVVARDRLTVDLRIEASGGEPRAVQAQVNTRMAAALEKARPVAAVKATTGNYDTYQDTPVGPDGKPQPPAQWHTVQTLSLTGQDFSAALGLAGQLQGDGLLLSGMRFDLSPETLRAQEEALTDEALAAIKTRASQIATTLGLAVTGFQQLTIGNAEEQGRPGPRPMMMARAASAEPPPAAAAGDALVSVSVDAEIALAPASAPAK
jgi:predicted secreted protein